MSEIKPVLFVAGRMNPPTPGHIKLIKAAVDESKKNKRNCKSIHNTNT
jgi:nicotinic acid mononucleotide adenylyltransferase